MFHVKCAVNTLHTLCICLINKDAHSWAAALSKSTALNLVDVALFDLCGTNQMILERDGMWTGKLFQTNLRDHLQAVANMFFTLYKSLYPPAFHEEWVPNALISTLCMPSLSLITRLGSWWSHCWSYWKNIWHHVGPVILNVTHMEDKDRPKCWGAKLFKATKCYEANVLVSSMPLWFRKLSP